ncbi:uridine kinase [Mycoplasma sp. P36-A1]|uniref:uridine kinase n=1 Tax=Mycoplasma sp. P36-A1 TaxID=3252900 RepID=UPI003C2BA434
MDNRPLLIGIAGGSASGKTSVSQSIYKQFAKTNRVFILKMDDYYNDQSNLLMEDRIKQNYDHPMAFDNELMIEQVHNLVLRKSINKPTYDYTNHTRSDIVEIVEPADVIIIEGLFALENACLRELYDLKVFVDTDADIRFIRRLKRDVTERGRSYESVINQYMATARPMHNQFVEPSKMYADIIIPEGGSNHVAIDLINTKVSSILTDYLI